MDVGNELHHQSSSTDEADAMFAIAIQYMNGYFTRRDFPRAKAYLELAVRAGNVKATNELGHLLYKGAVDVPRNPLQAKRLFERAISQGNLDAVTNLADLLAEGAANVPKNLSRAKQLYEHAVDAGDARAMSNLGYFLETEGDGSRTDFSRIRQLYEKATSAGDVSAICRLAMLLYQGAEGVPKDISRTKELFKMFVSIGSSRYIGLTSFFQSTEYRAYGRGVDLFLQQFAGAGNADAMYHLGDILAFAPSAQPGLRDLYQLAANAGRAGAISTLGMLWEHGTTDTSGNAAFAKGFYTRGVKMGNARALHKLGMLLRYGSDGVSKNILGAKRLLEHAADIGLTEAMNDFGVLLYEGDDAVAKDAPSAKLRFEQAVCNGSVKAMINLGALLSNGAAGVPRDAGRSKQLFAQAAENGVLSAAIYLSELVLAGDSEAREIVQQNDWGLFERATGTLHDKARSALDEVFGEGVVSMWKNRKLVTLLMLFLVLRKFPVTVMARVMIHWRRSAQRYRSVGVIQNMSFLPIDSSRPSSEDEKMFLALCRTVAAVLAGVAYIAAMLLFFYVSPSACWLLPYSGIMTICSYLDWLFDRKRFMELYPRI